MYYLSALHSLLFILLSFILLYNLINKNYMVKIIVGEWLTKKRVQITFSFLLFSFCCNKKKLKKHIIKLVNEYFNQNEKSMKIVRNDDLDKYFK